MLNGYLINPAVAGSENYIDIKTGYRRQWTGIEGAPESTYLTVHLPLGKLNMNTTATSFPSREENGGKALYRNYLEGNKGKIIPHHGFGVMMITDEAGAIKRSAFNLTYAYHLPVGRTFKMSTGINLGAAFYDVNEDKLALTNPDDPAFLTYNHIKPVISAGAMVYSHRLFAGFTASQLLEDEISGSQGRQNGSYPHLYLTGGYKIAMSPKFSVLPSTLVKYLKPLALSMDFNLKLLYGDRIWLGGSYRSQDAVVVMGGINIDNLFQVSYAYDMAYTGIGSISAGSHDFVIGVLLNNRGRIFSPSDFW